MRTAIWVLSKLEHKTQINWPNHKEGSAVDARKKTYS